jgi:dTDP-4-dehydrorhamnose reductase
MRIAVVGSSGQLGNDVVAAFRNHGDEVFGVTHEHIEVSDAKSVGTCLGQLRPDLIVNTAAMHHVEKCENDPASAFAVNAIGPRNLAIFAKETEATLMHVSTDYVFDGSKRSPYVEDDLPLPLNVYGCSKLAGECFVRVSTPKHFVLRTSGIYGHNPCRAKGGLNFVELMLKLGRERGEARVVNDEFVSPTSTAELAQQLVSLSSSNQYGLYHATAEDSCSWFEFAREIFAVAGLKVNLKVAAASEFPAKVPRPPYSVLENQRLKSLGLNTLRPWQSGLRAYLAERVEQASAHVAA